MARILGKSFFLANLSTNSVVRHASHSITTPIFYVNGSPHIGHVYTLLVADALNIYHRLKLQTNDTIFTAGTDEHGIKIQQTAAKEGLSCQQLCDKNSDKFRNLVNQYEITCTDFIRTSEERHKVSVQSIWQQLDNKGFIYKSTYSGWYSSSEETFVPESQVSVKNVLGQDVHVDSNDNLVTWSSEENYMFRMSKFRDQVHDWLKTKQPVIPEKFNQIALDLCDSTMKDDLSISRSTKRCSWGIQVPGDPEQTIYVWLDALTNYLTTSGFPCDDLKRWPIDCQVIGKDIIKFHSIYWPSFLLALSLPLPKRLICHSHWVVDSIKMSKSKGNMIDPIAEEQAITKEGLRYYLLRAGVPHSDTDYSRIQAVRSINSEIADTYGNLLSRVCGQVINPTQTIPTYLIEPVGRDILELIDRLLSLGNVCSLHFEEANFYRGIDEIMSVLRLNNLLYENAKPWKLIKQLQSTPDSARIYHNTQAITFETLRICSILLQPIMPKISKITLDKLNSNDRDWMDARLKIDSKDTVLTCVSPRLINSNTQRVLFPKIKASDNM